jgi:hypothetical protein
VPLTVVGSDDVGIERVEYSTDMGNSWARVEFADGVGSAQIPLPANLDLESMPIRYVRSTAGVRYEYGFVADRSAFVEEWLYAYPTPRKQVVIDELESSLHPLLARQLVKTFSDPQQIPRNAQLVFSTHDTNLLGTIFRAPRLQRDHVWLTERKMKRARPGSTR